MGSPPCANWECDSDQEAGVLSISMKRRNTSKKELEVSDSGKKWPMNALRFLCLIVMCAMASLICLSLVELLNRGSARLFFVWTRAHEEWLWRTLALLTCWNLFCICLRGKPSSGIRWGNGLAILLAIVNYYKKEFRSEPFELTDLTQAKEGLTIVGKIHLRVTPIVAVSFAAVILVIPLFFPRKKLSGGLVHRMLRAAASFVLLFGCFALFLSQPVAKSWRISELYSNGGFLRGLFETMPKNGFPMPEGYSREAAERALAQLKRKTVERTPVEKKDIKHPDIVFIMSESLYDLTKTGALQLSEDPLRDFRALQAQYAGGEVMALGYGGGTYYSEYEVLTGYRVSDTPGQLYYDSSVMREDMDTVLTVLKKHGYHTMAIHPNDGGFYRRAYNYRCMGFEETLFKGDGIDKLDAWANGFPSDRALFSLVAEKYTDWASEGSRFMHIVTYQNHGSYGGESRRKDIVVWNRDGDERQAAENFANGILEHTEALADLLSFFDRQERPVVVVVWGDHAPNMKEFGVEMPASISRQVPYYLTPLLIWNNYGANFTLPSDGILPPYRLGAYLLSHLGFSDDPYFSALGSTGEPDLMSVLRFLHKDGIFYTDEKEYSTLDLVLRTIHYDRLLGERVNTVEGGVKK